MGAGTDRRRAPADRWGLPGLSSRWLTLWIVLVVLALGGVVTVMLYRQADQTARDQESDLAVRAERSLTGTARVLAAGFAGSAGLVDADGQVDETAFDAYADHVAEATGVRTVGWAPVVEDADRAEYEQQIGGTIKEIAPSGGLQTASHRDEYTPVTWTHPIVDTSDEVRGLDLSADRARGEAMAATRDSGQTSFSEPISRQPDGVTAVFVVQALYRPDVPLATTADRRAALIGYVTASITGDALIERMLSEAGPGVRVRVADNDNTLAATSPPPAGGHDVKVLGGGRPWVITLQTPSPSHATALLALLATIAAAGLIAVALLYNRRKTLQLRSGARAVQALGQLSEHLADAESLDRMADAIATYAPVAVGARRVVLALDDPERPGALVRRGSGGEVLTDAGLPLVDTRRSGADVLVHDAAEMRRRYPVAAPAYATRGTQAFAGVPLRRAPGHVFGVIGLEWADRERFAPRTRDAITAVVELCQQNVLRVEAQERRRATAAALSRLGQRLSVVRTLDEVAAEIVGHAPSASGAPIVAVGFFNQAYTTLHLMRSAAAASDEGAGVFTDIATDPAGPLTAVLRLGRRVTFPNRAEIDKHEALRAVVGPSVDRMHMFPLLDSTGTLQGLLVFVWANSDLSTVWNEPGRMLSIADLTAQTVERAQLYQRQHDLVLELQRRTLPEVPAIPGLAIAARYLPSSSALGLGGDWYEVQQVGEGNVGLVVGDVVGHGIQAIADMTEIRTAVSTLLRTDTDLARVVSASSSLLAAHGDDEVVFATVVLMVVDRGAGTLRYVRAGHPPPMVRHRDGSVAMLDAAGTTPIGVEGREAVVGVESLEPGAVIVAYTDGLVERRDETIDVGLGRLRDALAGCAELDDVEMIADHLIRACLGDRPTDDDIALLVVTVRDE